MKCKKRWVYPLLIAMTASAVGPTISTPARADDVSKARADYQEGRRLESAGNYAQALKKFQAVAEIKPTPQVQYHVALCQEKLGKWVAALGGYRIAAAEAQEKGLDDIFNQIQGAAENLEKKVPTLTLHMTKSARTAAISLDGVEIGHAQAEKPIRVDPGSHEIEAKRKGYRPFSQVVTLKEGAKKKVDIKLKALPNAAEGETEELPPEPEDPTKKPKADEGGSSTPYIIGGIGLGLTVLGGVFYLMSSSKDSSVGDQCINNVCPQSAQADQDSAQSLANMGNVSLGLGLVGVGVGAIMLLSQGGDEAATPPTTSSRFLLPKKKKTAPTFHFDVSPTRGGMGARVFGTFLAHSEVFHEKVNDAKTRGCGRNLRAGQRVYSYRAYLQRQRLSAREPGR